jgi:hypothetical protein
MAIFCFVILITVSLNIFLYFNCCLTYISMNRSERCAQCAELLEVKYLSSQYNMDIPHMLFDWPDKSFAMVKYKFPLDRLHKTGLIDGGQRSGRAI